ncbi:hypothetical protein MTO96_001755 [Rhipicephalus appendiculatus]
MQQAKDQCWVAPPQPHDLLLLSSEESSTSAAAPSPRPFQCTVCGKQLASRNVHQLHMRSHSGEKPFGSRATRKQADADLVPIGEHLSGGASARQPPMRFQIWNFPRFTFLTSSLRVFHNFQ